MPVLTVSELTREIRSLLEDSIGEIWVEGEISNHRLQSSGHQYFTLKDAGAQLSCVMFRGNATRAGARLTDGVQIQAFGQISVYEPRGQYQMIVRQVQEKGLGSLQARFEALKRRLAEEGLFDQAHKQPVPRYPRTVALVTSPTGAAIQDMLNILSRRAPWVRVLVFPVRVQGQGAEKEIARAIELLNRAQDIGLPVPDTIVVGRGGGSLEDLWNFNEEIVARAIFASRIPVISAVGHEIDFTIADFVADVRAPTPSAAAELLAPDITEMRRHLEAVERAVMMRTTTLIEHHTRVIDLTSRGVLLREPVRHLERASQSMDDAESSLTDATLGRLRDLGDHLGQAQQIHAKHHPALVMQRMDAHVKLLHHRLAQAAAQQMERRTQTITAREEAIKLLGPGSILARGFSYTTDARGKVITHPSQASPGDGIVTVLADGTIASVVK
jgi:exodeoxyribonuclease VII large subunit